MQPFQRYFVIVLDSAGIGAMDDAYKFQDEGTNTWKHIAEKMGGLHVPSMNALGIGELDEILGTSIVSHPHSYCLRLNEKSAGKDTMTGHWEMMGIETTKPFMTFTDTGFPKELMDELERRTGHSLIGNIASSGTEILKVLGEQQMKENSLIIYTSADSVLQIAAHEEVTGVEELYRCCAIARELCMDPRYKVGRVIARPFVGTNAENFKRTPNRHDYALSPSEDTVMDVLKDHGYDTICIGKISDIFNGKGVTERLKTVSNEDGMNQTIEVAKSRDFKGLCFINLVEFDSEYGHRRNPLGYGKALEAFDRQLEELLPYIQENDCLMITADHGNDPTWKGTDHTRERVPLLIYSPKFQHGRKLDDAECFGDIGATIIDNFHLEKPSHLIGTSLKKILL